MTLLAVKDANGIVQNIEAPLPPGSVVGSASRPVTLSTEDKALLGSLVEAAPATGLPSAVLSGVTSATILAANVNRKGATITNDDENSLYLLLSAGTASATVYTVLVPVNGYYELPVCKGGVYTGAIVGVWTADGNGSARVTEFT
jgi:hypothetical protein